MTRLKREETKHKSIMLGDEALEEDEAQVYVAAKERAPRPQPVQTLEMFRVSKRLFSYVLRGSKRDIRRLHHELKQDRLNNSNNNEERLIDIRNNYG